MTKTLLNQSIFSKAKQSVAARGDLSAADATVCGEAVDCKSSPYAADRWRRVRRGGRRSLMSLGGALRRGALLRCAVALCVGLQLSESAAALAVFDGAVLSQSIKEQVLAVEQWARDNVNQARQIDELLSSNNIASGTQSLMDKNYTMNNKHSWSQIHKLQQDSLTLLYATKAIWDEFGSANRYYASFKKAQAWDLCMQSGNCTFSQTLERLEDSSISQAMQAYQNAERMNDKLLGQIEKLKQLSNESQTTNSQAATLDGLSKINGSVASSMVDLNAQIAQLTKLQGHALAKQSNKALADEYYFREVSKSSGHISHERIPVLLP